MFRNIQENIYKLLISFFFIKVQQITVNIKIFDNNWKQKKCLVGFQVTLHVIFINYILRNKLNKKKNVLLVTPLFKASSIVFQNIFFTIQNSFCIVFFLFKLHPIKAVNQPKQLITVMKKVENKHILQINVFSLQIIPTRLTKRQR